MSDQPPPTPLNIDQRLDRLTERHEALAESVQMLFASIQEQSKQILSIGASISGLVRVAEAHQRRIEDLEDRNRK